MHPQRRTALISIGAAVALIALKLGAGLAANSLGLVSEAAHSGTDLIAALLTFFAVGVAVRPADVKHQYGHGKAEHLGALAEAAVLVVASAFIAWRAITHLVGSRPTSVEATWYAFLVIGIVIVIDLSRTLVSWRASRQFHSAALGASALHFGSDLFGSVAVLFGLLLVRAGHPRADSAAALFVAVLVLLAAARLMKRNVDVLMDRAPADAEAAAVAAIAGIEPAVTLSRLRMRQSGARQFADVVITVPQGAAVGQGHAAADSVEAALHDALPGSDVVVHVEPAQDEEAIRDRAHSAALGVPRVREVHNVSVLHVGGGTAVSLHLKLPGELTLDEAHEVATQVEQAIKAAAPEVGSVQTHLEPLAEAGEGRRVADDSAERDLVMRIVREITGHDARELRFLYTDDGLVAHLTLGLEGGSRLSDAHARASEIEERIRRVRPEISDVVVHTEP
ncbi:MAG TPA: cation diffusion facilitator family transporter [Gaiellaceae bacterium]|nr:cation diffusion facilitator family transporter [Gaiellaceae bacterium]